MELDPITADFPCRTAREEDEEAAERATGGGLAPEAVAMVREFSVGFLMAKKRASDDQIGKGKGVDALTLSPSLSLSKYNLPNSGPLSHAPRGA